MKIIIFILTALLFFNNVSATVQQPDLLIIGKDTIELREMNIFPLESLTLKIRPFGYTSQTGPSTSCWRGYRATWRVINDTLYLEKIQRCHGDENSNTTLNLKNFFQSNDIKTTEKNGLILADWVNLNLYELKNFYPGMKNRRTMLTDIWFGRKRKNRPNYVLTIKNGIVENKLCNTKQQITLSGLKEAP